LSADEVLRLASGRSGDGDQGEDGEQSPEGDAFSGFGEPRQAFVFSATLTLPDEDRKLVR
jgi:hypothetical protein